MKTTYTLEHPIKFGEREVTEFEVTKPTPKLLKLYDMSNLSMSDMIKIVAACVGEAPPLIEMLDLDDYMGVVNILEEWFRNAAKRK